MIVLYYRRVKCAVKPNQQYRLVHDFTVLLVCQVLRITSAAGAAVPGLQGSVGGGEAGGSAERQVHAGRSAGHHQCESSSTICLGVLRPNTQISLNLHILTNSLAQIRGHSLIT